MKRPGSLRSGSGPRRSRAFARGSGPRPAPIDRRRKPRTASEFKRIYGSKARVIWIKAQPSVWDGAGPCVNAHVGKEGKGASRKANADQIVPLTDAQHRAFDEYRAPFDVVTARVFVVECCPKVQRAWLAAQAAA